VQKGVLALAHNQCCDVVLRAASKRLTKRRRLTKPLDYQHVFNDARKVAGNGVTALVRANELGEARLGLIISKRCSKKAVSRNHFKRVVRESFRLNQELLGGHDIVIIGQPGIGKMSDDRLRMILIRLWNEISQCDKF
jgi:ribonuclease P protein component